MRGALILVLACGCTAENPFHGAVDLARKHDAGFDFALPEFDFSVELPDLSVENPDLSAAPRDLATRDLVSPDLALTTTTVNAIDTGQVPDGTNVTVSGLILIGIARFADISGSMRCIYEAFAQDPLGVAPSGIRLFAPGGLCTPGASGCTCPFPPTSGTLLDGALTLGERFTVSGFVDVFMPPGAPTLHGIQVTTLTSTGSGTITPLDFTSGSNFATNGSGYTSNESMLVRIIPAAPFTISTVGAGGSFTGAGAQFAGLYRFVYSSALDPFPPSSSTWSSIIGVAQPGFGGGIAPRQRTDFAP